MPKAKKIPSFICDIAPLVPLPFGRRETYSYLSKEVTPEGSLVSIPFGPREIRGVVLSCYKILPQQKQSSRLKMITNTIEPSFLTKEQILLARTISEQCLTSIGKTLRHFLPTRTKERTKKISGIKKIPFRIGKKEQLVIDKIVKETRPVFLESPREATLRMIAGTIRRLPKSSQALILVPERIALPGTERFFSCVFGADQVVVLSSSITSSSFFTAWEKIRSGKIRVIVGTRQALFAPFRKLGLVVLLEESEALGYKQWDMSPRYDARIVSEELAFLHGARLVFSGEIIRKTMSFRKKQGAVTHILATRSPAPPQKINIVNMREERFKKNYSLFSAELNTAIADTKARDFRSFLIVSQSGLDRFSVCEECKTVPRCPHCDRALRSTREGHFRCGSCSFKTTTFPRCASCGSLSFKNIGVGTEKIEQELRRRFPELRIVRIDERELRKPRSEYALFEAALSADVVIGTPSSLNLGILPKVGLIAILDAENLLSFPDFQADERFVRLVRRSGNMVACADRGSVIIQTFRPEQELLRNLRDGTERATLDRAFEDRKILRYPPFFSLFRINFHAKEESDAERIAKDAYTFLSEAGASINNIHISPAQKPLTPKTRGRYERFIIISLPAKTPFPTPLRDALSKLSNWTFDPDPLSLI